MSERKRKTKRPMTPGEVIAKKLNDALCFSLAKAAGRPVPVVRRILAGNENVDIRAVQDCFTAFGIELHFTCEPMKPRKKSKQ